jgi:RHS repeat-associated protein
VYQAPINYLTTTGAYAPINDTLVPDPSAGAGAVANVANAYRVSLPGSLSSGAVQVNERGQSLGFSALGAGDGTVVAHGDEATYAGAYRDTTLRYFATGLGVVEQIVLSSRNAPSRFSFRLSLPAGARPVVGRTGEVEVIQHDGRVLRLRLAAPTVRDAGGALHPAGSDVSTRVARSGSGWKVVVSVSRRWLDARGRRFPVIVDPTVQTNLQGDCFLTSGAPNTNWCPAGYMEVGQVPGYGTARSLLGFVLPSIPNDAIVTQASVSVDFGAGTALPGAYMWGLTRPPTGGATWNTYNGTNSWTTPGGDYFSTPYDQETIAAASGYTNWDINTLVQKWVNYPSTNFGVELTDDSASTYRVAYSATTAAPTSEWPYLDISWVPHTGAPSASPMISIPQADGASLSVNAANGNAELSTPAMAINGDRLNLDLGSEWESLGAGFPLSSGGSTASEFTMLPGPALELYAFYAGTPYGLEFNYEAEMPDGTFRDFYPDVNNPGYYIAAGTDALLFWNGTYWVMWMVHDQVDYFFNSSGQLVDEIDNNGDAISYNYGTTIVNGLHQLASATDTQGRTITPSYNSIGQVTGWSDSTGPGVSYGINGSGQLADWVDRAGRETQYSYDASGNITQITDPDGDKTQLSYNSAHEITQITRINTPGQTNQVWHFSYSTPTNSGCVPTGSVQPSSVDYAPAVSQTVVTDPNGNQTTYCTDVDDRTDAMVDAAGDRFFYGYDADDDVTGMTELLSSGTVVQNTNAQYCGAPTPCLGIPSGDVASNLTASSVSNGGSFTLPGGTTKYGTAPDSFGAYLPASSTDTQNHQSLYCYDAFGNVLSVTDALGNTTQPCPSGGVTGVNSLDFTYENESGMTNLLEYSTDPDGNRTAYAYYPGGDLYAIGPPSPRANEYFGYDALSRVTLYVDGDVNETTTTYNGDDQVTGESYTPGSTSISYGYDNDGLMTSETGPGGLEANTYNALGELTQTVTPTGQTLSYTYDPNGNLKTLTDGAGTTTYYYNNLDELTSLVEPTGHTTLFSYDALGDRTNTTFPNSTAEGMSYNAAQQETGWLGTNTTTGTTYDGVTYNYNSSGAPTQLIQSESDPAIGNTTYTYDALNRLTAASTTGALTTSSGYTYDAAGNRTGGSDTLSGTLYNFNYTYNAANELTGYTYSGGATGSASLSYDADGNETSNGALALTYNAADQTSSIGGNPMTFFGTGQTMQTDSGAATLVNSQLGLSQIITSSGSTYIIRDNQGNPIGESTPSGEYYYLTDNQGTIDDTTNSAGTWSRLTAYDPYGNVLLTTGTGPQDLGYEGSYYGQPGGFDHFGARLLDSTVGRWTQPDPSAGSLLSDPTQADAYTEAGDDPINMTDLTGTSTAVCAGQGSCGWCGNGGFGTGRCTRHDMTWNVEWCARQTRLSAGNSAKCHAEGDALEEQTGFAAFLTIAGWLWNAGTGCLDGAVLGNGAAILAHIIFGATVGGAAVGCIAGAAGNQFLPTLPYNP